MEDTTLGNLWTDYVASPVEQATRDVFGFRTGETVGDFLKPKMLVRDGVEVSPANKIFNEMPAKEMKTYIEQKAIPSEDKDARHLYRLRHPETGEVKWGTSKGGVQQRYKDDPEFQDWIVEYDQPTENAEDIENTIHGNKALWSEQGKGTSLRSGNTERVGQELAKDYFPSTTQLAGQKIDQLLTQEQKDLQSSVRGKATAKSRAEMTDEQFIADLQKKDTETGLLGSLSTSGGIDIEELSKAPQYTRNARQVLEYFGGIDASDKTDKQVTEWVNDFINKANWNLVDLGLLATRAREKGPEASKALLNVMEMYDTTSSTGEQFLGGVQSLLSDPTTYLGAGTFISQPAKQGLKKELMQNALLGAVEGGLYAGAEDVARQGVSTKATGEDYSVTQTAKAAAVGAGLGATLAGLISAVTKSPALLNKAKKRIQKDPEAFKKEAEGKPEVLAEAKRIGLVDESFPVFKTTEKKIVKEVKAPAVEKAEVKPKKAEPIKDKAGKVQKAEILKTQKKQVESSTSEIVDPRIHEGQPVEGQVKVPEKAEEFATKIGWDFRYRTYDERGKAINFQGGDEAKFSQAIKERKKIANVDNEIERRMKIYDSEESLRKAYGDTQAVLKGTVKETGKAKDLANRNKFLKDNLYDIANNASLPKAIRNEARSKAEGIKRVVDYKTPKEVLEAAKKKHKEQFAQFSSEPKFEAREKAMKKRFEEETKANTPEFTERKEKWLQEQRGTSIVDTLEKQIADTEPRWREASQAVEELSEAKGKRYSPEDKSSELSQHQKVIDDYTNLIADKQKYADGEISLLELQSRMKARLEEKQFEESKLTFKSVRDYNKWAKEQHAETEKLGLPKRKLPTFKEAEQPDYAKAKAGEVEVTKTKEKKEAKSKEEDKSLEESIVKNKSRAKALKEGTAETTKLERELLRLGIEPEKVANIKAPIGQESKLKDLRAQWKTDLVKEANDINRVSLGIPLGEPVKKIHKIKPTDTTTDFSNSVGQNVALITADKDIADVTKLTGTTEDIRTKIAERVTLMTGKTYTKTDIKPLFMQQLYGQMEKGLIRTVKGDEVLFKAYDEVMKKDYPAFYRLSDELYKLGKESKTGEFRYTLPDGVEVNFSLKGKEQRTAPIGKDKQQTIELSTHQYDEFSRAIAPNVMHSIDGYVIRKIATILGEEGIDTRTIHDALTFKTEHTERVKDVALGVQIELLESNILDDIMRQLGYKGEPIKGTATNRLTKEDVLKSRGLSMSPEHIAGEIQKEKYRQSTNSRVLSEDELMREYMASGNVKLAGTNQLLDYMVTEAGYNSAKYSVARTSDDAFEIAMAEALQGKPTTRLITPKELNEEGKRLWRKNQRELLREARAKAERNPMLVGVLQGERKFFSESGKSLLTDKKTLEEIKTNEMRTYRRLVKSMSKREVEIIREVESSMDLERLQKRVYSWKDKKLSEDEAFVKKTVVETMTPEEKGYTKSFLSDQINDTAESKEFDQLNMIYKTETDNVSKTAEWMQKNMNEMIKKEDRKDYTKHLLNTDFHSIQEMTKESAIEFKNKHIEIFKRAEKHILQGAKALNEESEQIGAYINNPLSIARHSGLPEETAGVIDKLISIEAMTDESWGWIAKHSEDNGFRFAMKVVQENKRKSRELFRTNAEDYIKGYTRESYEGNFKIENGKVIFDADTKREQGILPITAETKKVGTPSKLLSKEELPKEGFKDRQELIEFAKQNNMKITDKGLRKVQEAKLRDEAGRSKDFNKILTETTASIDYKVAQRNIVKNIEQTALQESNLVSKTEREGFRKLTKEENSMLPYNLQEIIKYVNVEYAERLLGRNEVRLYKGENQTLKIADRLWKDLVTRFKQDVVLKNPASHINALVVNQTIGAIAGMKPNDIVRFSLQASKEMEENIKIMKTLSIEKATGDKQQIKRLEKKLEQSELYKMEQLGLSTNLLEGVRGNNALLNDILSKASGDRNWLNTGTNFMLANQGSITGDALAKSFSHIDTQGRFALAKHFQSQGMSLPDAVKKANGLFGDMDKMAPEMIDAIDKYGLVPFAKWFTLTTPSMMKLVKNNPVKAIAITIAMLYLQDALNWNNASQNPAGAVVDFAHQAVTTDMIDEIENFGLADVAVKRMQPYVLPSFYKRGWNAIEKENKHLLFSEKLQKPMTEDFPDYRGLTQTIVEYKTEGE